MILLEPACFRRKHDACIIVKHVYFIYFFINMLKSDGGRHVSLFQ